MRLASSSVRNTCWASDTRQPSQLGQDRPYQCMNTASSRDFGSYSGNWDGSRPLRNLAACFLVMKAPISDMRSARQRSSSAPMLSSDASDR